MSPPLPPQPPAMFTDSLVTTAKQSVSRRKVLLVWTSIALHLMGGAALFAASLMSFEVLERPPIKGVFNAPPPPPPPPPPPARHHAATPVPVVPIVRPVTPTTIRVPTHVVETPKEVVPQDAAPDSGVDEGVEGGVEGGVVGGVVGGVIGGVVGGVEGGVDGGVILKEYEVSEPPKLISSEDPVYPEVARQQGLDGKVIIELVIDENGSVVDARVMRSDNVIFNASALSAVKKRRYSAARNNGRAVRTYKSVTIVYRLH